MFEIVHKNLTFKEYFLISYCDDTSSQQMEQNKRSVTLDFPTSTLFGRLKIRKFFMQTFFFILCMLDTQRSKNYSILEYHI